MSEYTRNHDAVRRTLGRAALNPCIDCGGQAKDWSHRHGTDATDPANYDPRCRRCHAIYDRGGVPRSEVTRAKMSESRKGHRPTEETRAKMSEGQRRWRGNHD